MRKGKRALALFLALLMLVSLFDLGGVSVTAESPEATTMGSATSTKEGSAKEAATVQSAEEKSSAKVKSAEASEKSTKTDSEKKADEKKGETEKKEKIAEAATEKGTEAKSSETAKEKSTEAAERSTKAEETKTNSEDKTDEASGDSEKTDEADSDSEKKEDAESSSEKTDEAPDDSEKEKNEADSTGSDGDTQKAEAEKTDKAKTGEKTYTPERQPDDVIVKAYAKEGIFADGTMMQVAKLSEQDMAKAEQTLTDKKVAYDGAIGYDISFYNSDGEEIEPERGSVRVTFEMKASLLPDEAKADSLAVRHLKAKEDGIAVETVASAANTESDKKITVEEEKVKAEFAVDSFSYFIITYNNGAQDTPAQKVKVHLVDEDGNPIPAGANIEIDAAAVGTTAVTFESLAKSLSGYQYQRTCLTSKNGTEIKRIRGKATTTGSGKNQTTTYKLQYSTSDSSSYYNSWMNFTDGQDIYMVYKLTADLYVEDHIADTTTDEQHYPGCLTVSWKKKQPTGKLTYKWYSSTTKLDADASGWTEVTRQKVTGTSYNLAEDGSWINVALDDGAQKYYKVEAYNESGNKVGTALSDQVHYYKKLMNGSFETPDMGTEGNYQYAVGTSNLYWKTTGSDNKVELVKGSVIGNNYGFTSTVPDGKQYAELNAGAPGALYQDILTIPGSTMNWNVAHRGRNGTDTMYLIIIPASMAVDDNGNPLGTDALTTKAKEEYKKKTAGVYVKEITDSNSAWKNYSDSYVVPEGQYATRFFFVAGTTEGNNLTVGNLVDSVAFSTETPPPSPDTASVTVEKTLKGLPVGELDDYVVDIAGTVNGVSDTTLGHRFGSKDFYRQQDGSYKASYTYHFTFSANSKETKKIVLTETPGDVSGQDYELKSSTSQTYTVTTTTVDSTTTTTETADKDGSKTGETAQAVTLQGNTAKKVSFTNVYKRKDKTLTVSNTVTGNMGDTNKDFSYTLTLKNSDGTVYTGDKGDLTATTATTGGTEKTLKADTNGNYTFTLKHGEQLNFTLPYGCTYSVTEADYSTDGYKTTVEATDSEGAAASNVTLNQTTRQATGTLTANTTVAYTNTKSAQPPTGVAPENNRAWLLATGAAAVLAAAYFWLRQRYREQGEEADV